MTAQTNIDIQHTQASTVSIHSQSENDLSLSHTGSNIQLGEVTTTVQRIAADGTLSEITATLAGIQMTGGLDLQSQGDIQVSSEIQTQKQISLVSEQGVTIENAINANAGVTINAQNTITQHADMTTNNADIVLTAGNALSLTTIDAGSAAVTLYSIHDFHHLQSNLMSDHLHCLLWIALSG
jgi:hypothetical protein